MSNGDYIRAMDDERLVRFLCTLKINTLMLFLRNSGDESMNPAEMSEWIKKEDFVCKETKVDEAFVFDQNFNIKSIDEKDEIWKYWNI